MQEGNRHILKLESTGNCPRTNNGSHIIEMPDDDAISRGRLPWCVQCGIEFSKTEAELMAIIFARAEVAAALEELRSEYERRALSKGTNEVWRASFNLAYTELDATIAHLGLTPEKENT